MQQVLQPRSSYHQIRASETSSGVRVLFSSATRRLNDSNCNPLSTLSLSLFSGLFLLWYFKVLPNFHFGVLNFINKNLPGLLNNFKSVFERLLYSFVYSIIQVYSFFLFKLFLLPIFSTFKYNILSLLLLINHTFIINYMFNLIIFVY